MPVMGVAGAAEVAHLSLENFGEAPKKETVKLFGKNGNRGESTRRRPFAKTDLRIKKVLGLVGDGDM
jgi:hypothetical protein